jgi:hypothetical protein
MVRQLLRQDRLAAARFADEQHNGAGAETAAQRGVQTRHACRQQARRG